VPEFVCVNQSSILGLCVRVQNVSLWVRVWSQLPIVSLPQWSTVVTGGSLCHLHTHEHTHVPRLIGSFGLNTMTNPAWKSRPEASLQADLSLRLFQTPSVYSLFLKQKKDFTVLFPDHCGGLASKREFFKTSVIQKSNRVRERERKKGMLRGTAGGRSADSLRATMTKAERSRPPRHLFNTGPPTLPEAFLSLCLLLYVLVYYFFNLLLRAKTKQSEGWMAFQSFPTSEGVLASITYIACEDVGGGDL